MRTFRFWTPPAVGMFLAVAIWGPFGFRSDYDGFLLGMLLVPVLALLGIMLSIALLFVQTGKVRLQVFSFALTAIVTAGSVVAVWATGKEIDDPVRYALWSVTHPQELARAKRYDGVFLRWDSWGMVVTGDFDSYLVSYRPQPLRNASTLRNWLLQRSKDCGMPHVEPMDTGIYVITTANCSTLTNDIDVTKDC